jgi:LuxR family transcriptional regulator, maltose regulon positive regulatory protein
MSSLDQLLGLSVDHSAAVSPNWSIAPCTPIVDSAVQSSEGAWAIRRAIARARSALVTMRLDEASKATNQVGRLLSHQGQSWRKRYAATHRLLEASLQVAADQHATAHTLLMTLPSLTRDPTATALFRYLDWMRGRCDEGCMPDTVDYLVPPVGGKAIARILSLCVSAAQAFDRLHLTVSSSLASEALGLVRKRYGNHSASSAFPATLLAQVAYEQGRFEEAEALLRPRIAVIRASGTLECVARASVLLARLSLHKGLRRAALAILRDAEALGHTRHWPRLTAIAEAECSRALAIIHNEEGPICERGTSASAGVSSSALRTAAQLAVTTCLRRLSTCPESPWSNEPQSVAAIRTSLRSACTAASEGRFDDSYEILIGCLRIGAARGLRMIFVDAGYPSVTLLEGLYEALPTTEGRLAQLRPYVATLLRFTAPIREEAEEPPTYRPLSRRETGILQMIAGGLSNKRIAQSLGITPETVKSHAKSIFVKLDTRTRAQAVARAESIGLL